MVFFQVSLTVPQDLKVLWFSLSENSDSVADFAQPATFPQSHKHPPIPLKSGKSIIKSYSFTTLKKKQRQFLPPTLRWPQLFTLLGAGETIGRAGL